MIKINGKVLQHCTIDELREYFIGRKYGRLTITNIERIRFKSGTRAMAVYICECGTVGRMRLSHIINRFVPSCGCLGKETMCRRRTLNHYWINNDYTVSVVATNDPNIIFTVDLYTWIWLSHLSWRLDNEGYMATKVLNSIFKYHTLLYPVPPGTNYVRDHRNRCKLDNRYCNLRVVTSFANSCNRSKKDNCTTNVMGVSMLPNGKYIAILSSSKYGVNLNKHFDTLEEAIAQREEWEIQYQQIEELNVPPLFLPNGELNVYNFPFHWYPDRYIKIWGALGIRVLPYPYKYTDNLNTLNRLYNRNNY